MIDSLERLKDVLKGETNALNESIRYLESKRAENRSFISKLESEREELLESNRVLRDRNQNLMNSTVIPRLRFEARVSGIYMGYRSDGVRDPAMIIRGEAGLGYRFGLTGTKSTGDVIGVYAAIVRHDLSTAGQWSISGYDAGLFVESFDDENAQKGYCLYKVGCKGPMTYNSCGIIKWNNGTSYPIQSGHGCFGCSEENFWDKGPIYQQIASFPGFGIESNADKIGMVAAGVAVAGAAVHAVATNVQKMGLIKKAIDEGKEAESELKNPLSE